jgi:hypothetical protein
MPGSVPYACGEYPKKETKVTGEGPMIDEKLRFAIAHRRLLQLSYHGKVRIVEPHDYGVQGGKARLLIYQISVAGQAENSKTRGWRLLDVSSITACETLKETFAGSRGRSHRQHLSWEVVYARVGV